MKKIILSTALMSLIVSLGVITFQLSSVDASSGLRGSVDTVTKRTPYGLANQRMVVSGWAKDLNRANESIRVRVYSPTIYQVVDEFTARSTRNDVPLVFGGTERTGFNWAVPARFHDDKTYEFVFLGYDSASNDWREFGRETIDMPDLGLYGDVDYARGRRVHGWALDMDGDDPRRQNAPVILHIDGQMVASTLASEYRPDVDRHFSGQGYAFAHVGEYHGFSFDNLVIPPRFCTGEGHRIQVFALEFTEGKLVQIGQTFDRTISEDCYIQ